MAKFSERVRRIIFNLRVKQKDFAWLLGISPITVSRWISGEMEPSKLTDMVIKSIELVIERGKGEVLAQAIKEKRISGGTPDALGFISELAFDRSPE